MFVNYARTPSCIPPVGTIVLSKYTIPIRNVIVSKPSPSINKGSLSYELFPVSQLMPLQGTNQALHERISKGKRQPICENIGGEELSAVL